MTDDTEWRAELEPGTQKTWRVVECHSNGRFARVIAEPEGHDKETARLIAAAKDMQKALEFYAAGGMWQWDIAPDPAGTPIPNSSPVECDRGQIARAALAKSRLQT